MRLIDPPCRRPRRLLNSRHERGQVVLLIAFAIVAVVGVAALAIDASFMYDKRNRLQAAADAAAKSAALEVRRGNTSSDNLWVFAQREVTALGFDTSIVQQVNCPPTSGSYTGGVCGTTSSFVEVILQETTSTFFGGVFSITSMTPGARAVAGSAVSANCLITLGTSGVGINLYNNAELTATNCSVAVNSNGTPAIQVSNNADLTADAISAVGTVNIDNNGSMTPTAQTGAPPAGDPLAGLAAPTIASPCTTNQVTPGEDYTLSNGVTETISPGTYCGFDLSNNVTLNMNPGIYVIAGGTNPATNSGFKTENNVIINGTGGVMIYNAGGGAIMLGNNVTMNIVAPTSGTWAGISIFQPSSNTRSINVSNNGIFNVSGVTYAPAGQFRVANNAQLTGACMVIVAESMSVENNGGTLASDCSVFGGNPLRTVRVAE